MTFGTTDPLASTDRRDIIFLAREEREKLNLAEDAAITMRWETGAEVWIEKS